MNLPKQKLESLREIAEKAKSNTLTMVWTPFYSAFSPDVALALIAEIERLNSGVEWLKTARDGLSQKSEKVSLENMRFRETLEFYAEDKNYNFDVYLAKHPMKARGVILDDSGAKARKALEGTPDEK